MLKKDEVDPFKMLISIFKEHNRQVAALIGTKYSKGTADRYETSLKHTQAFLKWKYNVDDINIEDINHEFIMAYDFYLHSEHKCANNYTVKYMKNFKKIILMCIDNGWLDKDPFIKYKPKVNVVARDYLTKEELETMATKS